MNIHMSGRQATGPEGSADSAPLCGAVSKGRAAGIFRRRVLVLFYDRAAAWADRGMLRLRMRRTNTSARWGSNWVPAPR